MFHRHGFSKLEQTLLRVIDHGKMEPRESYGTFSNFCRKVLFCGKYIYNNPIHTRQLSQDYHSPS